jgi:hypothetical protein
VPNGSPGIVSPEVVMAAPRILTLSLCLSMLAAFGTTACRSSNAYDIGQPQAGGATLVVRNDNYSDVDVYVVSSGLPSRVGTVTGNSTARFSLNPSLVTAPDFRVVATPIGGNGRASSGPLLVSPGQTVYFTIGPVLSQSFATVQ